MPRTALPLIARIVARIRRREFSALADRVEVLHPAQKRWTPAPICLPDEQDRIIACNEASPELEISRLAEGWHEHGPTILRSFDDAIFLDGTVYAKSAYLNVRPSQQRVVKISQWETVDNGLLCSTFVINRYFGHWLTDGLPLELLAQDLGIDAITPSKTDWLHEAGYREMLGSTNRQVFGAKFKTLQIADDRGLNDHWLCRIQTLRQRLAAAVNRENEPRRPVFVTRGLSAGSRMLTNEVQLVDALESLGFIILRPEQETAAAVANTLHQASLVIAVEGSAQAHAMLALRPGTPLVSIMPPRRFTSVFKPICDALDIPSAYTVADYRGAEYFDQSIDRLRRLMDLLHVDLHGKA